MRVCFLVDVREVTLHHAKRNSQIIGNLFERALVASHGAQHVGLAWCEAVSGDEFRLQLFFSGALSPEKRMALLTDQLKQHEEKLAHLKGNMGKFSSIPPEDENDFADYLVLHGAVLREETNCKWLKDCIKLCKKGV